MLSCSYSFFGSFILVLQESQETFPSFITWGNRPKDASDIWILLVFCVVIIAICHCIFEVLDIFLHVGPAGDHRIFCSRCSCTGILERFNDSKVKGIAVVSFATNCHEIPDISSCRWNSFDASTAHFPLSSSIGFDLSKLTVELDLRNGEDLDGAGDGGQCGGEEKQSAHFLF